jgi:hypothetical protein
MISGPRQAFAPCQIVGLLANRTAAMETALSERANRTPRVFIFGLRVRTVRP